VGENVCGKEDYLNNQDVKEFTKWLGEKMDSCVYPWLSGKLPWYKGYEWNGKSFKENQDDLKKYKDDLKKAFEKSDSKQAKIACLDILKWGGVTQHNKEKIEKWGNTIIKELKNAEGRLKTNVIKDNDEFSGIEFNSGFVKIYSLFIENFMMYDGRVGAGLCYLVREFCKDTGRDKVPDTLAFTFGKGRTKKNRNPSDGKYQFKNHDRCPSKERVAWTIKANWLLNHVLDNPPKSQFNTEAEPLRAFEAALFMMGDDLSRFEKNSGT
jgi:hypothetical protein